MIAHHGSRVKKVLALLVLAGGCGEDRGGSRAPTPTAHATPTPAANPTLRIIETPIDYEYYLIARKEGLYCVGETFVDGPVNIYPEARLWVPWPLQKGLRFRSFLPYKFYPEERGFLYTVEAVDGDFESDAGDFADVGFFRMEDDRIGGYLRGVYGFQPGAGWCTGSLAPGGRTLH